jgi:hypothetical protein
MMTNGLKRQWKTGKERDIFRRHRATGVTVLSSPPGRGKGWVLKY